MQFVQIRKGRQRVELLENQGLRLEAFDSHPVDSLRDSGMPLVNIYEADTAYTLRVLLPGVRPEDIELHVAEDGVSLACSRGGVAAVPEDSYRRQERWTGRWSRDIAFPRRIDPEKVSAELTQGLLTIRVQKATQPRPRRVAVQGTSSL